MRCFIMLIIRSPRDSRFITSTLVRTVYIPFVSVQTCRLIRLRVYVYRYPCGRLWFRLRHSSYVFFPPLIGFHDIIFQSVSEMLPYTCLPAELLYSRLGVRPFGLK